LARPPSLELVDQAEELQGGHQGQEQRPRDDGPEQDAPVDIPSQCDHSGGCEHGVLGELERAHEMRAERVARVEAPRPEEACEQPGEEGADRDPEREPAPQRPEAGARPLDNGRHCDRKQGDVSQVDRNRADAHRGLVVDVQEDERDRRCEHERRQRRMLDGPA
jgi:hypothetical protein